MAELVLEQVAARKITREEIGRTIDRVMKSATPGMARSLAARLKNNTPAHLRRQRRDRAAFQRRPRRDWGGAIDSLEALWSVFREFGEQFFAEGLYSNQIRDLFSGPSPTSMHERAGWPPRSSVFLRQGLRTVPLLAGEHSTR
jgi:hypothetical protein